MCQIFVRFGGEAHPLLGLALMEQPERGAFLCRRALHGLDEGKRGRDDPVLRHWRDVSPRRDLGGENPVSMPTLTDHAFSLQGGAGPAREGELTVALIAAPLTRDLLRLRASRA